MTINRRTLLRSTGLLAAASIPLSKAFAADCATTPAQTAGPFYPVQDQDDKDRDLTRFPGLYAKRLVGRQLPGPWSRSGRPAPLVNTTIPTIPTRLFLTKISNTGDGSPRTPLAAIPLRRSSQAPTPLIRPGCARHTFMFASSPQVNQRWSRKCILLGILTTRGIRF